MNRNICALGEAASGPPLTHRAHSKSGSPRRSRNSSPTRRRDVSQISAAASHIPTTPSSQGVHSNVSPRKLNLPFVLPLPRTPPEHAANAHKGMPQTDDPVIDLLYHVLAEISVMRTKLDELASRDCIDKPQRFDQPMHIEERPEVDSKFVCGNRSLETQAKLKRFRVKTRFLGAMIAASKRNARSDNSFITKNTSKISNVRKRAANIMPSMWDTEGALRMKALRQTLRDAQNGKSCREKVWQKMESPYSSKAALLLATVSNAIVVTSVFLAILEASASVQGAAVGKIQIAFEGLFAIELFTRLICCPHRCDFMCNFFSWIDLLSVLPLVPRVIACLGSGSSGQEDVLLVLVPAFRLLKLLRRFEKLQLLLHAFELALEALPVLLYTLAVLAFIFSELIYFVEPRSNIPDLSTAMWYTIVTMTTVGYGDYTPANTAGHIVASVLMITSALYMAIPIGIVGNAFSEVWNQRDRLLVMHRFRNAFLEVGFNLFDFQRIFEAFDDDGNGMMDIDEFSSMLKAMQMNMSEERLTMLYQALDKEGAGYITLETLIEGLAPNLSAFKQAGTITVSLNPLNMIRRTSNLSTSSLDDSLASPMEEHV